VPSVVAYVDMTPPSSNTNTGVGGRGKPQAIARTKGEWEGLFLGALMAAKLPKRLARVHVKPQLKFKRKGKAPDADNFYFAISKPLGDALQKAGYITDDDPEHYRCERPEIEMGATDLPPLPKSRTTLEINYELPAPPPAT
jgi:Holliday junction resolvase RusA-like endonuclease